MYEPHITMTDKFSKQFHSAMLLFKMFGLYDSRPIFGMT
jgi:hypothetical protein